VLERLLGALGVGGPTVGTVLDPAPFGPPAPGRPSLGLGMGTAVAAGAAGPALGACA
jgi:hypothetical protein